MDDMIEFEIDGTTYRASENEMWDSDLVMLDNGQIYSFEWDGGCGDPIVPIKFMLLNEELAAQQARLKNIPLAEKV